MRCPWCGATEDRVVDSREVEHGDAVRRRRACLECSRRFTTIERRLPAELWVMKRSGARERFSRDKLLSGVRSACKNRPVAAADLDELADAVEQTSWSLGPEVPSDAIGLAVLDRLRSLDEVAAVRFASVYKGFEQVDDFARELDLLQPSEEAGGTRDRSGAPAIEPGRS